MAYNQGLGEWGTVFTPTPRTTSTNVWRCTVTVEVDKEEKEEELVAGSPVDNEFISDAFLEGHYDEEDLKKEMQQLGMDGAEDNTGT